MLMGDKMEKLLTIFTPTYNRQELLKNLYNSLKNQTDKNFTWLIVDDGSTDDTEQVVTEFIKEKSIDICYKKKQNGGKHSAMDFAHSICETEYIACVDSDDLLTSKAVEEIYKDLDYANNENCVGLVYRRATKELKPFSDNWVENNKEIYFYELDKKYGYNCDTFLVFKTDIVRNYKFPKFENEKFVTEKVLYNQFMFEYKMVAVDKLIYIGEYQAGGYTDNAAKLMFKNPMGTYYAFKSDAYYLTKYKVGIKKQLFAWARYYSWKKINKYKNELKNELNIKSVYKFLGWLLSPVFYFRYKKKQKSIKIFK